jgi:hypothetical protein
MDLEQAYRDAQNRRSDLEDARSRERRECLAKFTAILGGNLDAKYRDQIRQARAEEAVAEEALGKWKEEQAKGAKHPYPLGTVMVEWEYPPRLYRNATPQDRRLTKRKGVLEIITAESEHPSNWGPWKRAYRGELVIRLLKADGKPSSRYVKASDHWERKHWVPEGTDLLQPELRWPGEEEE